VRRGGERLTEVVIGQSASRSPEKSRKHHKKIRRSLLPTPTARDVKGLDLPNRDGSPSLGELASRMIVGQEGAPLAPAPENVAKAAPPAMVPLHLRLPTPTTDPHGYMIEGNAGTTLTDYALGTSDSPESRGEKLLCLNPRFVEWLMGWPIDHTLV
jgi:hypothetical protein